MKPARAYKTATPAPPQRSRTVRPGASRQAQWAWLAVASAAVLLFVILKLYSVNVVIEDAHLYFNMALLVNKGLIPHRDFFYTHPPLHLYLAAFVFRLFGYSLALGKSLPNAALLIGGILVFTVGRRALGSAEGALACAIFLLSYDPLRISSHYTGGNLTFALAMAGLWLAYIDRPVLAGVSFGLGALVAVYITPAAASVAVMLWWRSRRRALRFVVAAAAVALAGNLLLYGLAGWDFVYQVYLTQFQKGKEGSLLRYTLYHRLGFIMYENRMLTAGAVAGLVLLAAQVWMRLGSNRNTRGRFRPWQDRQGEALVLFVTWFVLYWVFYLSIRLQHAYYFLFIMPVFAWFSAYAYAQIGRSLLRSVRPAASAVHRADRRKARRRPEAAPGRGTALLPAVVALVLTLASVGVVDALYVPFALRRYGQQVRYYPWRPLHHLQFLDPLVRAAFWQPQYDPRRPPWGITRYLQHESSQITAAPKLYAAVRQYTQPGDPIFGEVGLIPLIASETGRRVAANLVDTSTYRISYGLSRIEDWIAAIEKDHVRLLVVRERQPPMRYPKFRQYARRHFKIVQRVRDPQFGWFEIMLRRDAGRAARG